MSRISELTELITPVADDLLVIYDDSEVNINIQTKSIRLDNLGVVGPQGDAGEGVPVGGTTGQVLAKASNTNYDTEWITAAGGSTTKIAIIEDRKATTVNGGDFTAGSFIQRTLNTLSDPFSFMTLTANEFRINETGIFLIRVEAPAYSVNSHLAKLVQVGAPDVDLAQSQNRRNPVGTMDSAFIEYILTVSDTALFYKIMHRAETTRAVDGFGTVTATGAYEKYTTVIITKIGNL